MSLLQLFTFAAACGNGIRDLAVGVKKRDPWRSVGFYFEYHTLLSVGVHKLDGSGIVVIAADPNAAARVGARMAVNYTQIIRLFILAIF